MFMHVCMYMYAYLSIFAADTCMWTYRLTISWGSNFWVWVHREKKWYCIIYYYCKEFPFHHNSCPLLFYLVLWLMAHTINFPLLCISVFVVFGSQEKKNVFLLHSVLAAWSMFLRTGMIYFLRSDERIGTFQPPYVLIRFNNEYYLIQRVENIFFSLSRGFFCDTSFKV